MSMQNHLLDHLLGKLIIVLQTSRNNAIQCCTLDSKRPILSALNNIYLASSKRLLMYSGNLCILKEMKLSN